MIERAEVLVLSHRLSRTRLFSTGSNVTRDSVVVRLEDGDGRVGWGETYLVPGAVEACPGDDRDLAGPRPRRRRRPSSSRGPGSHRWALGAVSMALDDLRGRSRGVPVSALYGARLRDRVRPYASSRGYVEGRTPLDAWSEEAATTCTPTGFRAMKLRIGRYDLDDEIAAIERVVADAPPMTWMADGNGAYSLDESRRLGAGARGARLPLARGAAADRRLRGLRAAGPGADDPAGRRRDPRIGRGGRAVPGRRVRSTSSSRTSRSAAGSAASSRSRRAAADAGRCTVPHACSGAIAMAATLQILAVLDVPPDAPAMGRAAARIRRRREPDPDRPADRAARARRTAGWPSPTGPAWASRSTRPPSAGWPIAA